MIGVIYKYTSPSGKVYIGQTLNEYMRRAMWKNIAHPYAGPYINNARKKYGYNNFQYEVLIKLESDDEHFLREQINRLEQEYIAMYDSTNPNKGYNITCGGLGHVGNKNSVISDNCRKACIKSNIGRKQSKEQIYKRFLSDPRHKQIECWDLHGNLIKTFFCLSEASKQLNIPYQAIQRVLKGKRKTTKNLIFKYKNNDSTL